MTRLHQSVTKNHWAWPVSIQSKNWSSSRRLGDRFRRSTERLPQVASTVYWYWVRSALALLVVC